MKSDPDNQWADLVITGGTVHTMDPRHRITEAVAVTGDRITRVGPSREVVALIGPGTRVVHLEGRSLLPGINDSHLHATWLGHRWPHLLLTPPETPDATPPETPPEDPDATPPENPVAGAAEWRAAILRAGELLSPLGITSYTEPGLGPGEDDGETGCFGAGVLTEYAKLAEEGLLTARVTALMLFGELDGPSTLEALLQGLDHYKPPENVPGRFKTAGVKIFADGIPPLRTAWSDEPYADGTHSAPLVRPSTALPAMIKAAAARGHQVAVHATGSRATRTAAHALAETRANRHYLIHGDVLHPETIDVMARAGIGLNTQPGIAALTGDLLRDALGVGARAQAWPVRDALKQGVRLCLSSDAPVLTPDWRHGVAQAITREDQAITLTQALRAYTITPAWQDGAETWKGSLEEGKVADLCVLDANVLEIDPATLPDVRVRMTVLGGRIVYEST